MVDDDARRSLLLTLHDVAEFFNASSVSRSPVDAAHLLATCIPVLDGLGCPYAPSRLGGWPSEVEHFTLRVEAPPPTPTPLLPATLVPTLTDIADYLAHLSHGGGANYAMENYVSAQCLGLLDELGVPHVPRNPLS